MVFMRQRVVAWQTKEVAVYDSLITLLLFLLLLFPLAHPLLETKASLHYSTQLESLSTSSLSLEITNNWAWDTKLQKDIQATGPLSIFEVFSGITLKFTLGRFVINNLCEKPVGSYCNDKKTVDKSRNGQHVHRHVRQSVTLPCPQ